MWYGTSQRETSQFPLVYIASTQAFAKMARIGFVYVQCGRVYLDILPGFKVHVMHEAGRLVLLSQTHTGKGLKLDPFLAWKNGIFPVLQPGWDLKVRCNLGAYGSPRNLQMKIFLTYATSNMDKSNEICGVSLSGFGTTLKIWSNFQAIWTHQGPRPKSWGKSFNFNPIIGYDGPHTAPNPHWASRWLSELMTTVIKIQMPSSDI